MTTRERRPVLRPSEAVVPRIPLAPPAGMRDLLPPASYERLALRQKLVRSFRSYGYDLVVTPAFELAEVIEGGIHEIDRRELLRFVAPETGEVALLRPDITPQIARIIATSLRDRPAPYRLCYEGSIFRRRLGRARLQQQISQAGVECVGLPGPDADIEVIELAIRTLEAAGLERFHVELAQVELGRAALDVVPEAARAGVVEALSRKDATALEAALVAAQVSKADRRPLLALVSLYGGPEVLDRARQALSTTAMRAGLDALEQIIERLSERGYGSRIGVDLGELRGQSYYTGTSFTLLADGPGERLGGGGRYDRMLPAFGVDLPATGFALAVDNVAWALRAAGRENQDARPGRVVMAATGEGVEALLTRLRSLGLEVSRLDGASAEKAEAFARAWGYDVIATGSAARLDARRLRDDQSETFSFTAEGDLERLSLWASSRGGALE